MRDGLASFRVFSEAARTQGMIIVMSGVILARLHFTVNRQIGAVRLLLERGADVVNVRDKHGDTPPDWGHIWSINRLELLSEYYGAESVHKVIFACWLWCIYIWG